jgi:2-methylaconitate cis-trans-isomerase PrpF
VSTLPRHTLRIPATLVRGGTSRGLVFKEEDLPPDPELRDLVFLAALGSPDVRQLDGVGAGDSHCSKVAVVRPSARADADVDFLFGEVAIGEPRVDYAGNSGNIIAALGPYALDEGWVEAREPRTLVRIHNLNTGKPIEVLVPVEHGRAAEDGSFAIDGVPGVGPRIDMRFPEPGGAVTGRLLTTDGPVSTLPVPGVGPVRATLVDAANPVVFVDGAALGVDPATPPPALNADAALLERLQAIRAAASVRFGLVPRPQDAWSHSPMIPFLVMLFAPSTYPSFSEPTRTLAPREMDLCARVLSLNLVHKSINVTVSVATTAAALIPGSLVHAASGGAAEGGELRIGHPSGVVRTAGNTATRDAAPHVEWVSLGRTARRIMDGEVLAQPSKLRWLSSLRRSVSREVSRR